MRSRNQHHHHALILSTVLHCVDCARQISNHLQLLDFFPSTRALSESSVDRWCALVLSICAHKLIFAAAVLAKQSFCHRLSHQIVTCECARWVARTGVAVQVTCGCLWFTTRLFLQISVKQELHMFADLRFGVTVEMLAPTWRRLFCAPVRCYFELPCATHHFLIEFLSDRCTRQFGHDYAHMRAMQLVRKVLAACVRVLCLSSYFSTS